MSIFISLAYLVSFVIHHRSSSVRQVRGQHILWKSHLKQSCLQSFYWHNPMSSTLITPVCQKADRSLCFIIQTDSVEKKYDHLHQHNWTQETEPCFLHKPYYIDTKLSFFFWSQLSALETEGRGKQNEASLCGNILKKKTKKKQTNCVYSILNKLSRATNTQI